MAELTIYSPANTNGVGTSISPQRGPAFLVSVPVPECPTCSVFGVEHYDVILEGPLRAGERGRIRCSNGHTYFAIADAKLLID